MSKREIVSPVSWRGATIQQLKKWRAEIDAEIAILDERPKQPTESQNEQNPQDSDRPCYRNPANQFERWHGRGKRPRWLNDWIAQGKDIEELRVN